mmetsp:Transcript_22161/g.66139  ORF Transcript_22161/g.66139 Transcript_22161/m.66139 type:complete len:506 (-) Transcript_22161:65-1582(-)
MATATLAPSAAHAAEMVPTLTDLAEVYESLAGVEERYQSLASAFEKQFGSLPEVLARAPGRVNLIGEHIDYSGYGVLPMAIVQDTVVAIKKGGTCLDVASVVPDEYPRKTFDTSAAQEVDIAKHSWANYFLCAYKGVSELLQGLGQQQLEPTGLQVLVQGNVPTGAGVSSSAALICASMLAILAAHGRAEGVKKADVAMAAARAERYVGVSSGGMDQAISMMGMKGLAKKVEFNPVRTEDVALPEGAAFVIGHSLAVSNKAVGAERRFNMRVVECRLAAMVLAAAMGHPKATLASDIHTLVDVESVAASGGGGGLSAVAESVRTHMHDGLYTIEEIEGAFGTPLEKIFEGSAVSLKVLGVGREDGGFRLRDRALHVFDEAQRVRDFKAVCDGDEPADVKLSKLGALMNASHDSCAKLYDCTCPELEQLTTAGRAAGAFGARLTGAGWGGCAVFLVKEDAVNRFLEALTESYYTPEKTQGRDMRNVLFASRPSAGAAVLKLKGVTA